MQFWSLLSQARWCRQGSDIAGYPTDLTRIFSFQITLSPYSGLRGPVLVVWTVSAYFPIPSCLSPRKFEEISVHYIYQPDCLHEFSPYSVLRFIKSNCFPYTQMDRDGRNLGTWRDGDTCMHLSTSFSQLNCYPAAWKGQTLYLLGTLHTNFVIESESIPSCKELTRICLSSLTLWIKILNCHLQQIKWWW